MRKSSIFLGLGFRLLPHSCRVNCQFCKISCGEHNLQMNLLTCHIWCKLKEDDINLNNCLSVFSKICHKIFLIPFLNVGTDIVVTTGIKPRAIVTSALVSAMCGGEHWARLIPVGKLTPAHSAGAHTARGLCVAPGRWVGAELTAAGPPTAQGYPWAVGEPPHQITWPPTAQGPI